MSQGDAQHENQPINLHILHTSLDLTVSKNEAERVERQIRDHNLRQHKLSLVVDLDQTVLHATVDPHLERWINDPSSPQSLKDVKPLQLADSPFTYYIKFRPGLEAFLRRANDLFELHIYTMGSRSYANEIVKLIDPNGLLFSDRIISRDESGVQHDKKLLKRIFPCDDRNVLIVDDRADVWQYSENLIQVSPFYFFVGTGDVNSRPGMVQHVLPEVSIPTDIDSTESRPKVMNEQDVVLENVIQILKQVHQDYFEQYQPGLGDGGIPDVKRCLQIIKSKVFGGSALVFSGITPVNSDPTKSHFWRLAQQYGAICSTEIDRFTTHVISYRNDTSKVLEAVNRDIFVVTPEWILRSIFSWERQPEQSFAPSNLPLKRSTHDEKFSLDLEMASINFEIEECLEENTSSSDSLSASGNVPPDVPEHSDFSLDEFTSKRRRTEESDTDDSFADELEHDLL